MSRSVDVLEVIDAEIKSLPAICEMVRIAGRDRGWSVDESEAIERLKCARSAVVELIEAVEDLGWVGSRVSEALCKVRGEL